MKETYNPMVDFWKRFFPFLFRQTPALIFMTVAVFWLTTDRNDIRADLKAEIVRAKKDCAEAITELRQELRTCRISNDTLVRQNIDLSLRLLALELKNKKGNIWQIKKNISPQTRKTSLRTL